MVGGIGAIATNTANACVHIVNCQKIYFLFENCCQKIGCPKIQNLLLKIPHLGGGEFRGRIGILMTCISSVGNLLLSVGKLQLPALSTFLTHKTTDRSYPLQTVHLPELGM